MTNAGLLRVAYAANILILVPVCWGMFLGSGTAGVFQGQVAESQGLRLLVASLWSAILLASVAGLWSPAFFAPVILIQIVYKTLWLATFVLPLIVAGRMAEIPHGIAAIFAAIVVTYPFLFWKAL